MTVATAAALLVVLVNAPKTVERVEVVANILNGWASFQKRHGNGHCTLGEPFKWIASIY